jgi:hypothetical protein
MPVSSDQAERVKDRVFALVSGRARVNGIGVISHAGSYAVKVGLYGPPSPDLPEVVDGVKVVYAIRDNLRPFQRH